MPAVISFTVETDGRLPSGQALAEAIDAGRRGDGRRARLLHDQLRAPDALRGACSSGRAWAARVRGLRANASTQEPRRARRGRGARRAATRTTSARATPPCATAAAPQRARRLLRHRPPPRGGDLRRLARRRLGLGALDRHARQHAVEPARQPPVAVAEHVHHRGHEHGAQDERVEEDGAGEADRRTRRSPAGRRAGTSRRRGS